MTFLKRIALCSAILGVSLSFVSCTNDENDERDTPEIFTVVSKMYSNFGEKTGCTDIKNGLKSAINSTEMTKACQTYDERRGGNYESLAYDKTNSGFYQSAYVLTYKMYTNTIGCTEVGRVGDSSAEVQMIFEETFNKTSCKFLDDAIDFTKKRGN